jgi:hypothetical protein
MPKRSSTGSKPISLATAAAEVGPVYRNPPWYRVMSLKSPKALALVDAWIDEWVKGEARDKLPSRYALSRFLIERFSLPVKVLAVVSYIKERERA